MNSGSRFLAEIRRTTSSLSPLGTVSVSTSVTKPYLYSWFANASMVSVDVLIVPPYLDLTWDRPLDSLQPSAHRRVTARQQLGEERLGPTCSQRRAADALLQ